MYATGSQPVYYTNQVQSNMYYRTNQVQQAQPVQTVQTSFPVPVPVPPVPRMQIPSVPVASVPSMYNLSFPSIPVMQTNYYAAQPQVQSHFPAPTPIHPVPQPIAIPATPIEIENTKILHELSICPRDSNKDDVNDNESVDGYLSCSSSEALNNPIYSPQQPPQTPPSPSLSAESNNSEENVAIIPLTQEKSMSCPPVAKKPRSTCFQILGDLPIEKVEKKEQKMVEKKVRMPAVPPKISTEIVSNLSCDTVNTMNTVNTHGRVTPCYKSPSVGNQMVTPVAYNNQSYLTQAQYAMHKQYQEYQAQLASHQKQMAYLAQQNQYYAQARQPAYSMPQFQRYS